MMKHQSRRAPKAEALDMAVGTRLRTYRQQLKMSQYELGKHIGVTFQQIQKYENGMNRISGSRMIAICEALRIKPNQLLGVSGDQQIQPDILAALRDREVAKMFIAFKTLPDDKRRAVAQSMMEMVRAFGGKV